MPGIGFCQYGQQYEIQAPFRLAIYLAYLQQVVIREVLESLSNYF